MKQSGTTENRDLRLMVYFIILNVITDFLGILVPHCLNLTFSGTK